MCNTNEQPEFTYKDLTGKKFTSNPADPAAYPSGLEYLTDGDPTTSWKPASTSQSVEYELTLDLGSVQQINGLKFVQRDYGSDREMAWFAPSVMKIAVSNNGATGNMPRMSRRFLWGIAREKPVSCLSCRVANRRVSSAWR